MTKLEDAEATLKGLEKYGHAVADANSALQRSKFSGDPKIIEASQVEYDAAVAAETEAAIDPRDVARAAEAVLALRGEQHTEEGILPPDFGKRTVMAERAVAEGRRAELYDGAVGAETAAQTELEKVLALDAADKAGHMQANHDAAMAAHEGAV